MLHTYMYLHTQTHNGPDPTEIRYNGWLLVLFFFLSLNSYPKNQSFIQIKTSEKYSVFLMYRVEYRSFY